MTTEQYAIDDGMTREQFAALYPEWDSTFIGPIHPDTRLEMLLDKAGRESGHAGYEHWAAYIRREIRAAANRRPLTHDEQARLERKPWHAKYDRIEFS